MQRTEAFNAALEKAKQEAKAKANAMIEAQKTKPIYVKEIIMSSSPSPALTAETFKQHMTAMKQHYQQQGGEGYGPTHTYVLPRPVMESAFHAQKEAAKVQVLREIEEQYDQLIRIGSDRVVVHAISGFEAQRRREAESAKAMARAVITRGQMYQTGLVNRQRDFVTVQARKVQRTGDTAAWSAAMNAQRQAAKAEANRHIDAQFDQLIDIGTEYPELQPTILTASQQIGAFLTTLLANLGAFFSDISRKIMGWLREAGEWLSRAYNDAKAWATRAVDTIEDAAEDIGRFFSSIF